MLQINRENALNRREVVASLLARRGNALVIAGVGSSVWDCAAAGDSDLNFYLWNAMGSAAMIGLGLALAQPNRPVLVITGDGDLLMQLGCLATIAVKAPKNLSLVVMDNGVYQETGGQPTHSGLVANLAEVARACGIEGSEFITNEQHVANLASRIFAIEGLLFAHVLIGRHSLERVMPPRNGSYLKDRFRHALLGAAADT